MSSGQSAERALVELTASGGPLRDILVNAVLLVEQQVPGMLCSIMLLDTEEGTLHEGAAPHLPAEFMASIEGVQIGPHVGSCGAAAFTGETIAVEDIRTHPNWINYRASAAPHGLRACWSTPILSPHSEVLGTFAMYYLEPRLPSAAERECVKAAMHIAALAITQDREHRALLEQQELQRSAGRTAKLGAWSVDWATRKVIWSDELRNIYELDPGESLSFESTLSMAAPEYHELIMHHMELCANEGTPFDFELPLITKRGRRLWVRGVGQAVRDASGAIVRLQGSVQDVSERRRLEEQLRQAQKMEAIGKLAGGVAHDFNNLLSVVLSYSAMMIDSLAKSDPLRTDAEQIQLAGTKAGELTQQLLAFSRQQVLSPRVLDLNGVLAGLEKLLQRLLGDAVSLSLFKEPVGQLSADPSQLEQVIMNLVVNARDAMPKGGKITIETRNEELTAEYAAEHHGVVPGHYVLLAVSDSGVGMDANTQARVFEPFFTTKAPGEGTGLGLATVWGIVTQSGGHIALYSELGIGSSFRVYLPRVDKPLDAELPDTLPPPSSLRGTETVLVVEDEEQVRELVCTILRRQGYNVLDAQNGGEAFLICEQYAAKIDLLLTDVVMARMTGRELAQRLAPVRPEMKVLYVSGYTENSIVHDGVLDGGIAYLPKPITPAVLLRKLRELLG